MVLMLNYKHKTGFNIPIFIHISPNIHYIINTRLVAICLDQFQQYYLKVLSSSNDFNDNDDAVKHGQCLMFKVL